MLTLLWATAKPTCSAFKRRVSWLVMTSDQSRGRSVWGKALERCRNQALFGKLAQWVEICQSGIHVHVEHPRVHVVSIRRCFTLNSILGHRCHQPVYAATHSRRSVKKTWQAQSTSWGFIFPAKRIPRMRETPAGRQSVDLAELNELGFSCCFDWAQFDNVALSRAGALCNSSDDSSASTY